MAKFEMVRPQKVLFSTEMNPFSFEQKTQVKTFPNYVIYQQWLQDNKDKVRVFQTMPL
jgi:hypothetical protein